MPLLFISKQHHDSHPTLKSLSFSQGKFIVWLKSPFTTEQRLVKSSVALGLHTQHKQTIMKCFTLKHTK